MSEHKNVILILLITRHRDQISTALNVDIITINPRLLSQNGQNDLEREGQCPPFSIPVQSIPRCTFDANLAVPVQIDDELSCGQVSNSGFITVYGLNEGHIAPYTDVGFQLAKYQTYMITL